MLEETQKAPKTAELEEPSCTPRRKSSWRPGLAKLTRLAEELIFVKATEEMAPNKTDESALVTQWHPARKWPGFARDTQCHDEGPAWGPRLHLRPIRGAQLAAAGP